MPKGKSPALPDKHPCTVLFWAHASRMGSVAWLWYEIGTGQPKVVDLQWATNLHWTPRHASTRCTVRRYQKEPATWSAQQDADCYFTFRGMQVTNCTWSWNWRSYKLGKVSFCLDGISYMSADKVGDQVEKEAWCCSAKNVARNSLQTPHQQSWMHQFRQVLHQERDENERHCFRCIPSFRDQAWNDHPCHDLNNSNMCY